MSIEPSYAGMREKPPSTIMPPTSAGGVSTGSAKILGRGTITLRTGVSVKSNTLWMISISVWSSTPCCRPALTRCLISSWETKLPSRAPRIPSSRSTARVEAERITTSQRESRAIIRKGAETRSAIVSL